jgi:hypothetical protein
MKKTLQDTPLLPVNTLLSPYQVAVTKTGTDSRVPFDTFKNEVLKGVPTIEGPRGPVGPPGPKGDAATGVADFDEKLTRQIPFLANTVIAQATLENALKMGNNNLTLNGYYMGVFKCNSANPVAALATLSYTLQNQAATIGIFETAFIVFGYENGVLTYIEALNTRKLIEKVLAIEANQSAPSSSNPVLSRDFPITITEPTILIWGRGESATPIVNLDFRAELKGNNNLLAFNNATGKTCRFKTIEITLSNLPMVVGTAGELTILIPRDFTKMTTETAIANGDEFRASFPRITALNVSPANVGENTPYQWISESNLPRTCWIDTSDTDQPTFIRLYDLKAYSRLQIYLDFGG